MLGAPTWRDASVSIKPKHHSQRQSPTDILRQEINTLDMHSAHTHTHTHTTTIAEKGWYLGKYLGKIVSGRNKNTMTSDYESIDQKMKRKRQLLKDYYSAHTSSDGFSSEFSMVSDLPLLMGWLRKRKPRYDIIFCYLITDLITAVTWYICFGLFG
jgi:hypothetical protein